MLHYYAPCPARGEWVHDDSERGGPLVKVVIEGKDPASKVEEVLVDQDFGDELGSPLFVRLRRASGNGMGRLPAPPGGQPGGPGVLVAFTGDAARRIPVDGNLGKKSTSTAGGKPRWNRRLPCRRPARRLGQFESPRRRAQQPHPRIETFPSGQPQPLRQLASAKKSAPETWTLCSSGNARSSSPTTIPGSLAQAVEFLQPATANSTARVRAKTRSCRGERCGSAVP